VLVRFPVLTEVQEAVGAAGIGSAEVEIVWDETWTTDRLSPAAVDKHVDDVSVGNLDVLPRGR